MKYKGIHRKGKRKKISAKIAVKKGGGGND